MRAGSVHSSNFLTVSEGFRRGSCKSLKPHGLPSAQARDVSGGFVSLVSCLSYLLYIPAEPEVVLKNVLFALVIVFVSACGSHEEKEVGIPTQYSAQINHLYNSNFFIWQRGSAINVAHGETGYAADRWYVKNSLGDSGLLRVERVEGVNSSARYGLKVSVHTAPVGREQNGCELFQTLENADSLAFMNRQASFSISVRGVGRTSQVGIQLMYSPTEQKISQPIGEESVFDVSDEMRAVAIQGQNVGSEMTRRGTIGVRIRAIGVKSGNLFDRGNGFVVEQAMLNIGRYSNSYEPRFSSFSQELSACQRYFEKSYMYDVSPGSDETPEGETWTRSVKSAQYGHFTGEIGRIQFHTAKRVSDPKVTIYGTNRRQALGSRELKDSWYDFSTKFLRPAKGGSVTDRGFTVIGPPLSDDVAGKSAEIRQEEGKEIGFHWTCEAEI